MKRHVRSILHIPLGLDHMFGNVQATLQAAQVQASEEIVLSDESSLWGADYYFAVSKPCKARRW